MIKDPIQKRFQILKSKKKILILPPLYYPNNFLSKTVSDGEEEQGFRIIHFLMAMRR